MYIKEVILHYYQRVVFFCLFVFWVRLTSVHPMYIFGSINLIRQEIKQPCGAWCSAVCLSVLFIYSKSNAAEDAVQSSDHVAA